MKKLDLPLVLLALAAFLAPILGGYIDFASQPLMPGPGPLLSALVWVQACTLAHAILGLLAALALVLPALKKPVLQLPQPRIVATFGIVVGLTALSIIISSYKQVSLTTFSEWGIYGVVLIAVAARAGRGEGPRLLCAAFVAGCTLVAAIGIQDYVSQPDPTWRIMNLWQDPNALAGMLVLGLFAAIGLGLTSRRSAALVLLIAAGIMGTGLLLTQSKGGLLAAFTGFLALFLSIGAYSRAKAGGRLAYMAGCVLLVIALVPLAQSIQRSSATHASSSASSPAPNAGPAPLGRLLNPAGTAEQSMGFRANLWKGALRLIEQNPVGYGAGTYRFQSTKPGNTTETKLAHNSFLQLAVEIGPLGALAFVFFLVLCAYEMLRGSRSFPERQNLLRAGVFAGLLASVVHNMVDSDFYFFGSAFGFFFLLGLGLALSSDALVPELVHKATKGVIAAGGAICAILLLYAGMLQVKIGWFLADLAQRSDQAPSGAEALRSFCPFDYRVWYYSVPVASSPDEQQTFAENAANLGPTVANYHRLAVVQSRKGQTSAAIDSLNEALKLNPNSLEALSMQLQIYESLDPKKAAETANRMVAIEGKPYFTMRSLPEIVPTETYEARLFLASQTTDPRAKAEMLRAAVQGFLEYATTTVPKVIQMAPTGDNPFGSPEQAKSKLSAADGAAKDLAGDYRFLNDAKDAVWADDAARTFEATAAELDKTPTSSK